MPETEEFETRLNGMFSAAPVADDAATFADQVMARLEREERVRGTVLWAVGLGGGFVAAASLASTELPAQIASLLATAGALSTDLIGSPATMSPTALLMWAAAVGAAGVALWQAQEA